MQKPIVFDMGRSVKIEVWGGFNTIGGNCIVIRDHNEGIMLDQGVCFSRFKKFYGRFIQPEIVEDLREVGAIPPRKVYEGVSEIYISHLHVDHLGSLSIPFEYDVKVFVPSKTILEKLANFWYWGWKELLLPSDYDFTDLKDVTKSKRIKVIQVSHSAFPSYSFLVETSEGTILYTGDFRINSPLDISTLKSYSSIEGEVDLLIIEGTNFLRRQTPLTPEDIKQIFKRILSKYDRNYLFLSTHMLDAESFILVSKILQERGYDLVLTHTKYGELLDEQLKILGLKEHIRFYLLPLRGGAPGPLNYIRVIRREDVLNMKKAAFLTSLTTVNEVKMLIRSCHINPTCLLQITLTGEPLDEEGWIMEARLRNWLRRLGINSIQLHLSGHYYPYEFKEIIQTIKPKKIIPIHTRAPKTMISLFERIK